VLLPQTRFVIGLILALAVGVWSKTSFGQSVLNSPGERAFVDDPPLRITKRRDPFMLKSGWRMEIDGGTGVGSFKDIQLPINRFDEVRVDGTRIGQENTDHLGFAFGGGVAAHYLGAGFGIIPLQIDMWRMLAQSGEPETLGSAYNRVQVGSESYVRFGTANSGGTLGVNVALRRSTFSNMSSSHFVMSVPIGVRAAWDGRLGSLSAAVQHSPHSELGYSESLLFGGQAIGGSSVSLTSLKTKGEWRLTRDAWFVVGAYYETIKAEIRDLKSYEKFGFDVEDPRPSRTYDLTTSMVTIGVRRVF
jgi:hypothetical protein